MASDATPIFPYQDPSLSAAERAVDLTSRMTLVEKVGQMLFNAPAIPRLGVPAYNWWNECLHGVGRAGLATVFPQAIGLAATWNVELMSEVAVATSDEARAKHHEALRQGNHGQYFGLTFWSPNINIFRDPRWGRGQETYGEDPYLTSRLGVAFCRGLQGDDPRYLKLVATPKHFAAYSGPDKLRHEFDAQASEDDLRTTYLPAFEACVREAGAASVMGAYNRLNGEPCCASPTLLEKTLRQEWGFDGYVVSDCGAIYDLYTGHKVAADAAEASAMAVQAGCDLNCGEAYKGLLSALERGLIDEAAIDQAVRRLFTARFRLGMFDPPEQVPYAQIPIEVNDSPAHRSLALRAARESIVLLKNSGVLPLPRDLERIAVIGPNADAPVVLLGNYHGTPAQSITPLQGIQALVSPETEVRYARGCPIQSAGDLAADTQPAEFQEALEIARQAEVVIFCAGLSQLLEGEEGQTEGMPKGTVSQVDRQDIALPPVQQALLEALHATGVPVVLVLLNGSAVAVGWADAHLPAIVEAWYPGQAGGAAVAEVLFGLYNPAGRLPVTFYASTEDLPPFEDYSMEGRTYRYFRGVPLYAFGHGLSYTRFTYRSLRLSAAEWTPGQAALVVQVDVENSGGREGDEVVQFYISRVGEPRPMRQLQGFRRIHLASGETQTVSFELRPEHWIAYREDGAGERPILPGEYRFSIGGRQPHPADEFSVHEEVLFGGFTVLPPA